MSVLHILLFVFIVRTLIALDLIKYKFLVSKMKKLKLRGTKVGLKVMWLVFGRDEEERFQTITFH